MRRCLTSGPRGGRCLVDRRRLRCVRGRERAERIRARGRARHRSRSEQRANTWKSFHLSAPARGGRVRRRPLRAWRFRSDCGERLWRQRFFGEMRGGLSIRRVGGTTTASCDGVSLLLDWLQFNAVSAEGSWRRERKADPCLRQAGLTASRARRKAAGKKKRVTAFGMTTHLTISIDFRRKCAYGCGLAATGMYIGSGAGDHAGAVTWLAW